MDNYDQAAEILKRALVEMKEAGIPDDEVPPVLADFALMMAIALLGSVGAEALIERMKIELIAAEHGERGPEAQQRALRLPEHPS